MPIPVIIMIICFAIGSFVLNKTYFGRYFYAVGGNIEAAKLSGIRVGVVKYLVFALSGLFSGLAGIVLLSRTNSGNASAATGYEFDVITCVVLGGVSITGGFGKMSGVVAGTFIIGALQNGMVLMNINSYIQDIVMGIVLALAVGFDCIQKNHSRINLDQIRKGEIPASIFAGILCKLKKFGKGEICIRLKQNLLAERHMHLSESTMII